MGDSKILMEAYLNGDPQAFQKIYNLYAPNIYRFLLKKTFGNAEEAEELLQNSFLKFHRLRDSYRSQYPLLQWLYVLARSEWIDQLRKNKSRQKTEKTWIDTQFINGDLSQNTPSASLSELKMDWQMLLKEIKPEAREIFLTKSLEEESFEEMAAHLNKNAFTLRQIYSRTRKKLKTFLKGEEES